MPECKICGEKIPEGSRTCSLCGSTTDVFLPTGTLLKTSRVAPSAAPPKELPAGGSYCPACGKVYGPEHTDSFCVCGTWLLKELPVEAAPPVVAEEAPPMAPVLEEFEVMAE